MCSETFFCKMYMSLPAMEQPLPLSKTELGKSYIKQVLLSRFAQHIIMSLYPIILIKKKVFHNAQLKLAKRIMLRCW